MSVTNEFNLDSWSDTKLREVEQALMRWINPQAPAGLGDAMRYAVQGGKRLRGFLVLPVFAWWLDRRRIRVRDRAGAPPLH